MNAHPTLDQVMDASRKSGIPIADIIVAIDNALYPAKPEAAKRQARKSADTADWRSEAAVHAAKQHIRVVAAELALMDAYEDISDVVPGYTHSVVGLTKGQMSDHYASLRTYLDAVDGIDIRQGSAYWDEAASLLA